MLTEVPPGDPGRCLRGRCPYQIGPRCTARQRRPLGCRVFFCRQEQTRRARELYEQYHQEIRILHQRRCVPYAYAELTHALIQLFTLK